MAMFAAAALTGAATAYAARQHSISAKKADNANAVAMRQREVASIGQQQAQQASQENAAEAAGQYSAAKNVRGRRLLLGDGAGLAEA